MSSETRPPIKPEIKRIVRKRCGYGCVICGNPFFHYDHIIDYSIVKEHRAENITLLCGSHHDQKTKGLLSTDTVRKHDQAPEAIKNPSSLRETLHFTGSKPVIELASNYYEPLMYENGVFRPFVIDTYAPISMRMENGQLLLNAEFYDLNDTVVIRIVDNEIQLIPNNLDIEITGNTVTIREGVRKIILKLSINRDGNVLKITRMKIYHQGKEVIRLNNTRLFFGSKEQASQFKGCHFGSEVAFSILGGN